jgi:hypothetical protein
MRRAVAGGPNISELAATELGIFELRRARRFCPAAIPTPVCEGLDRAFPRVVIRAQRRAGRSGRPAPRARYLSVRASYPGINDAQPDNSNRTPPWPGLLFGRIMEPSDTNGVELSR